MCFDDKSQPFAGTGVIIGPNMILTVAHNCFDHKSDLEFPKIECFPAPLADKVAKNHVKYSGFKVKKVFYPEKYLSRFRSGE